MSGKSTEVLIANLKDVGWSAHYRDDGSVLLEKSANVSPPGKSGAQESKPGTSDQGWRLALDILRGFVAGG